jgi:photosystem II stability/assembly factor-like uncharacterized protein
LQPTDRSVIEGATATFSAQASREASYQWQSRHDDAWSNIPGANNPSFIFGPTRLADTGTRLRVVIRAADLPGYDLPSSSVTLIVTAASVPPAIVVEPDAQLRMVGDSATFSVTATGTELSYRWQRSPDGIQWADVEGGNGASLSVGLLSESENGHFFRVAVHNTLGQVVRRAVRLTVMPLPVAPWFTAEPSDTSAVVGHAARFAASATGTPAPTLQWRVMRDPASGVWEDIPGQTGPEVIFTPTTLQDDGSLFAVAATNGSGTVQSAHAVLRVTPAPAAPTISAQPNSLVVGLGAEPLFEVAASGVPEPVYQWQVSVDDGFTFTNIAGAISHQYLAPAVMSEAEGGRWFRVVVSNVVGEVVSQPAFLDVVPMPVIDQAPVDQWWNPGKTPAAYAVLASGRGILYQWQVAASPCAAYVDIPGATLPQFLLPATSDANVDCVRVVVSNSGGSVTSSAALRTTTSLVNLGPVADHVMDMEWSDSGSLVALGRHSVWISQDGGLSWVQTEAHGPRNTAMKDLAFNGSGIGLMVGDAPLVRRSMDGGRSWISVSPISSAAGVQPLFNTVAFASPTVAVAFTTYGAAYRSADAGITWNRATVLPGGSFISRVAFSADGSVGLAVGPSGQILRSIDTGAHWSAVEGVQLTGLRSVTFVTDRIAVALGSTGGMLRTTDAGETWAWTRMDFEGLLMDVDFADAMNGVAVSDSGAVLLTNDAAVSWRALATPDERLPFVNPIDGSMNAVAVRADGVAVTAGSHGRMWRALGGWQNWQRLSKDPSEEMPVVDVAASAGGNAVAVGWVMKADHRCSTASLPPRECYGRPYSGSAWAAIQRSADDGKSWAAASISVPVPGRLRSVAFADADTVYAVGDVGAMIRSADGGRTWVHLNKFPDFYYLKKVSFVSPNVGFVLGLPQLSTVADLPLAAAEVLRTTDGARTWASVVNDMPGVFDIGFADTKVGVAVGREGAIRRTADGGASWVTVGSPTSNDLHSVRFADAQTVVAAGARRTLLLSTDAGQTWVRVEPRVRGPYSPDSSQQFTKIVFADALRGAISARYPSGVILTSDGGRTWTEFPPHMSIGDQGLTGMEMAGDGAMLATRLDPFDLDGDSVARPLGVGGVIARRERLWAFDLAEW